MTGRKDAGANRVGGDNYGQMIVQYVLGRPTRFAVAAAAVLVVAVSAVSLGTWGAERVQSATPAPSRPPLPAYGAFDSVTDEDGRISFEVPAEWKSRLFNGWHPWWSPYNSETKVGPGLNAAVNTSDWFDLDKPVPGVFVGASARMMRDGVTFERMTSIFAPTGCTVASVRPYAVARIGLAGTLKRWTCAGGSAWIVADLQDARRTYLVSVQMRAVGARDDAAFEHVIRTLRIRPPL